MIISNEEINGFLKIAQALWYSNILLKGIAKATEKETKEQKWGFLRILFGTLGTRYFGKILAGEWMLKAGYGNNEESYGNKKIYINSTPSFNKYWNIKALSKSS